MKYKRFEELPCWKAARELCEIIFDLLNQERFRKDYSLRDQIWRVAGSVMDNIAEGFDDGSAREFIRFLGYAQRSCGEVQSQLYRARDCGYIDGIMFDKGYEFAGQCGRQIKGLRKYLRKYEKGELQFLNSSIPKSLNSSIP